MILLNRRKNPYTDEDWALRLGFVDAFISPEHALLMAGSLVRNARDNAHRAEQYLAEANEAGSWAAAIWAALNHNNAYSSMCHADVSATSGDTRRQEQLKELMEETEKLVREGSDLLQEVTLKVDPQRTGVPPENETQAVEWYLHHIHEIQRLTECRRLAAAYGQQDAHGLDWNETARQALTATLQQTATMPQDLTRETGYGTEMLDAGLHQEAMRATEATEKLLGDTIAKYNESLATHLAPEIELHLNLVPKAGRRVQELTVPPLGAKVEFMYFSGDKAGDEDDPNIMNNPAAEILSMPLRGTRSLVAVVAYIHEGHKVITMLGTMNPYPKGFSRKMAEIHAKQAKLSLRESNTVVEAVRNGDPPPPPFVYLTYEHNIEISLKLAQAGLHCVAPGGLQELMDEAANVGIPPGARKQQVSCITKDSEELAGMLMADFEGRWRRTTTARQTRELINRGRELGIDSHTLKDIATSIGHRPSELDIIPETTPEHASQTLREAAEEAGLDEEAVRDYMTSISTAETPEQTVRDPVDELLR